MNVSLVYQIKWLLIACCCSIVKLCLTLWRPMDYTMPDFSVLHHFPELAQTHVLQVSDAIQPSHPLSPVSPPASIFPRIRVFSNESALHIRVLNYWSFSISPSNECSGLISFWLILLIDWFDLLAVQGTRKNLFQHHSSTASIYQHSVFVTAQHSYPYMTAGKTIALTR